MMEDDVEKLEWSKSTESLEDLLKNPKVKLPQLIRLIKDLEFLDAKVSLQSGQILSVLAKRTISYVNGTDSHGKNVSLTLCCPYTVQLQVPPQNQRTFHSVKDIIDSDPLPKFVEVTRVGEALLQPQCVAAGDILKVVFVEKSGHLPCFLHFRNSAGTQIKIDAKEDVAFQVAISYSPNMLLSSLFERYREFPAVIQFFKQDNVPKSYLELGMITLQSKDISAMDVIIASTNTSSQHVVVFPLQLGIAFEVNTKLKLANDTTYRELCNNFSSISVDDVNSYLDKVIGFKQSGHRLIMKYEKMKKDVRKTSKGCYNEIQGTNQNSKLKFKKEHTTAPGKQIGEGNQNYAGKNNLFGINSNHKSMNVKKAEKESMAANHNKVKKEEKAEKEEKKHLLLRKSEKKKIENPYVIERPISIINEVDNEVNAKVKVKVSDQKGAKKEKKVKKADKEEKKMVTSPQNNENKTIRNSLGVEEPASIFSRFKSFRSQKNKEKCNKLSDKTVDKLDDGHEKPVIENFYCQIPYETLDKFKNSRPSSALSMEFIPPPLPGNHPLQEKMGSATGKDTTYLDAVELDTCAGGFRLDKAGYSAVEISTWGIEDVGECLSMLSLDKHKALFEENTVDGKLLLDLDESILADLGLDIFEAHKLQKFVLGWRPGIMRPTTVYPPLKGFSSDDPNDWDVEDTASHMLEIDVPEMAKFCRENQVDGELLKDICADMNMMNFICPVKKLKLVKIKNYVIDKWRPKQSSGNEPCDMVYRKVL